ncbi:MAG: thioesterase domain-containing protein, partial [Chloroflexota bacterium]|nr:thioesterase domain-containing protein [Chloroflexota bacterium]
PYAGGRAAVYRDWARALPPDIDVCPVELPGRGVRSAEPLLDRLDDLVPQIARGLRPYLDRPFAFFGHSAGALIAFELARVLQPEYLFVSAHRAPHIPYCGRLTSTLSEEELLLYLRRLGGTPAELLREPNLLIRLLPVLRADSALSQTYVYAEGAPLACPILALGGWDDPLVDRGQLEAWRRHTSGNFSLRMLPGAHFYINAMSARLLTLIGHELELLRCTR